MARKATTSAPNGNGVSLGFEATLWHAADTLRGHLDTAVTVVARRSSLMLARLAR